MTPWAHDGAKIGILLSIWSDHQILAPLKLRSKKTVLYMFLCCSRGRLSLLYKEIEFHDCASCHYLNILTWGIGHWSPGLRGCTRGCQPCPGHAAPLGHWYIVCEVTNGQPVVTEGVHELVDQVEDGHLERDPALLPGLHADEQAVEAVRLPVQAVSD